MIVLGREVPEDLIETARSWVLGAHRRKGFQYGHLVGVIQKAAPDVNLAFAADRIADRIIQRMKKAGEIRLDKATRLWVKGTGD